MFIKPNETLTGELLLASISIVQIRLLKLMKNREEANQLSTSLQ